MAFKNLEARFNANVDKLYAGATSKFNDGKPSSGANDDPLIVRKPGDGYFNFADRALGRSVPISSTVQDVKRLTLFSLSTRGLIFLAKQQLLQTGNTFELTRIINPAFVVANAVPFLHVKRNLRPLADLLKKPDTSYESVRKLGQLQVGTYNSAIQKWKIPTYIANNQKKGNIFSTIGNAIKNAANNVISGVTSLVNPKRNIGDKFGYDANGWKQSRPELAPKNMVEVVSLKHKEYQDNIKIIFRNDYKEQVRPYIKYFTSPDGLKNVNDGRAADQNSPSSVRGDRASIVRAATSNPKKISYIKDPSNKERSSAQADTLKAYKPINHKFSDAIMVSFAVGNKDHVQFRSFIKDLQQTATPEYKQYQYIGRMERFVNYVGVQREISFKLGIVAFGRDELDAVWRRINYLTGLVYPYGFHRGLFQPNIVRLTIGDVYVNHPGYVTALNTNFSELSETWELDTGKQVPIAAQMDIKFTLIEKASRIAESPFYGITDGGYGREMQGFNKTITPAASATQRPPANEPIKQEVTARSEEPKIEIDTESIELDVIQNTRDILNNMSTP